MYAARTQWIKDGNGNDMMAEHVNETDVSATNLQMPMLHQPVSKLT